MDPEAVALVMRLSGAELRARLRQRDVPEMTVWCIGRGVDRDDPESILRAATLIA